MHKSMRVLLCWLVSALPPGCGPQEGGQLALQLKVARQTLGGSPRGAPPEGIEAFRLCVQKPSGEKVKCKDFQSLDAEKVRMDGIPAGNRRVVTFQGYTTDLATQQREVLWCGRATGVRIRDDQVTRVGMLLTRCGDFTETPAPPGEARTFHTASMTPDGAVVLLGGYTRFEDTALSATASAERYDPGEGTFTPLPGGLNHPRGFHAAMPLEDGRILVAGGCEKIGIRLEFSDPDRPGSPLRCLEPGSAATTLEIYDPQTGSSEATEIPATIFAGAGILGEDRLLLVGGQDSSGNPLRRVLLVDASGASPTVTEHPDVLQFPRRSPTAVPFSLPGTRPAEVLILGGAGAAGPDDPGTFAEWLVAGTGDVFTLVPEFATGASGVGLPVMHAAGTPLGPGRILFSGGIYPERYHSLDMPYLPEPLVDAAVVDMRTESFKLLPAEDRLSVSRAFHTSTRTDSLGHVLVAGGLTRGNRLLPLHHESTASVEWWDEEEQGFSLLWKGGAEVSLIRPRAGHTATRLEDGTVLLVGGTDGASVHSNAELFNPAPADLGSDGLPPL
jgi:hypothetical protein